MTAIGWKAGVNGIDRQLRARWVNEMFYAYCHYVPAAFFIAFSTQMGGPTVIARRIRNEEMDFRYEGWATRQMNRKRRGKFRLSTEAYRRRQLRQRAREDFEGGDDFRRFDP